MGFDAAFDYVDPAAIFREHAALSAFENKGGRWFDIGALATLDGADYDAFAPRLWPQPQMRKPPNASSPTAGSRHWTDGRASWRCARKESRMRSTPPSRWRSTRVACATSGTR
jgi:assimilatory nitrate reductase catalytic subunit